MRLFVSNVSYDALEEDLRDYFVDAGFVPEEVKLIMDRETGRSRGFAFLELPECGAQAIKEMDGKEFGGRKLNVREADERSRDGKRGRIWSGRRDTQGQAPPFKRDNRGK